MATILTPRAPDIPMRLLVSLLVAVAFSAVLFVSPAAAVLIPGVDLRVEDVQYLETLKGTDDSCRGALCQHSSDETRRAAVLYSVYNDGLDDSWGLVVHLRIDGQPWKTTQEHGGGLRSDGWIQHYFEIPPLPAGEHELEILIQSIPETGVFARMPTDVNPENDQRSVQVTVTPTL